MKKSSKAAYELNRVGSYVSATSSLWHTRQSIEISSESYDPDMQFVGSSPFVADASRTGVVIPYGSKAGTCFQKTRYLARLCGIDIPDGGAVALVGIRQYATIRYLALPNDQTLEGCVYPFELDIESPFWSFTDGNISWHIRYQPVGVPEVPAKLTAGMLSLQPYGSPYAAPDPFLSVPYQAPNMGEPWGSPVGTFGTWRDLRFPWRNTNNTDLHHIVSGPGSLVFYASIRQTNPYPPHPPPGDPPSPGEFARCNYDPTAQGAINYPGGLRREDQFLLQFPQAQYGRVAGALMLELLPEYKPTTQS